MPPTKRISRPNNKRDTTNKWDNKVTQPHQRMVTITLEGNSDFDGFDCRGRVKSLCDGCRLRFLCLSERDMIQIPQEVVKQNKIKDLRSVVKYMFSEGRIPYEIGEHERTTPSGETEIRLVMKVKDAK